MCPRILANLRHVDTVFLDGYRLGGEALRQASGLNGMPEWLNRSSLGRLPTFNSW
jgi:hypothetical protein